MALEDLQQRVTRQVGWYSPLSKLIDSGVLELVLGIDDTQAQELERYCRDHGDLTQPLAAQSTEFRAGLLEIDSRKV